MVVTVVPTITLSREVQPEKAHLPTLVVPRSITRLSDVQPEKAYSPIVFAEEGILTVSREVHP